MSPVDAYKRQIIDGRAHCHEQFGHLLTLRDVARARLAASRSEGEAAAWRGVLADLEGSVAGAREAVDMAERVYAQVSRHFGTDSQEREA